MSLAAITQMEFCNLIQQDLCHSELAMFIYGGKHGKCVMENEW